VWQPQAQDSGKAESKLGDGHLSHTWLNTYSAKAGIRTSLGMAQSSYKLPPRIYRVTDFYSNSSINAWSHLLDRCSGWYSTNP